MIKRWRILLAVIALSAGPVTLSAQTWAVRMTDATIARNPVVHKEWDYTAGVILLGVERLAAATKNEKYSHYVQRNIDALVQPDGTIKTYEMDEFNLDQINEGRVLFGLYARTHEDRYRKAIEHLREQLRHQPRTSEGGFWHKKIYPQQMWLDGIYMAGPFLAQYGKTFNDTTAFNEATHQILLIARNTRDAKTGLFYHAWDEAREQIWADRETGRSPNFWARGVGWYAMAIADVLDYLPPTERDRQAIIETFRDLAEAVAKVQDPVSGLWYDVLDQPTRKGNYLEASASSMFVYALAKGAHKGWLDAKYAAVARRGYDGLVRSLVTVDEKGAPSLNGIVAVSGLGGKQQRNGSFEYYISEPVVANDYKGVGPFILASIELAR
jgi:unsaturated rhamnogalacturonyl hydrolase